MYKYRATILNVVNANTVEARIDLGFDINIQEKLKLSGINVPDSHSYSQRERKTSLKVSKILSNTLKGKTVYIDVKKIKDSPTINYSAVIYKEKDSEVSYNQQMIKLGLARENYKGQHLDWTSDEIKTLIDNTRQIQSLD